MPSWLHPALYITQELTDKCKRRPDKWEFADTPLNLSEEEQAFITLTRIKDNPGEGEFIQATIINSTDPIKEIDLIPGKYEVEITSISSKSITIPEDEICVLRIIFCLDYETVPEVTLDTFPSGALNLNDETFYFHVPQTTLDQSKLITFYAVAPDLPGLEESKRKHEDLEQIDPEKIKEYINDNWESLQPKLE